MKNKKKRNKIINNLAKDITDKLNHSVDKREPTLYVSEKMYKYLLEHGYIRQTI